MTSKAIDQKTGFVNLHQDLIDLCKENNQRAQFQIYKLYYKAMYNISLRIVKNPMEAEDVMQESFLSAFEKINTYSGIVSFGAWLKKIVINRSLDALKKERKVTFEDIDSISDNRLNYSDYLPEEEEISIKVCEVKDAIKMLPKKKKMITSLYLLEGYDHEEIGEIMSISPVTSRSQFSRARHQIANELIGQAGYSQTCSIA